MSLPLYFLFNILILFHVCNIFSYFSEDIKIVDVPPPLLLWYLSYFDQYFHDRFFSAGWGPFVVLNLRVGHLKS